MHYLSNQVYLHLAIYFSSPLAVIQHFALSQVLGRKSFSVRLQNAPTFSSYSKEMVIIKRNKILENFAISLARYLQQNTIQEVYNLKMVMGDLVKTT